MLIEKVGGRESGTTALRAIRRLNRERRAVIGPDRETRDVIVSKEAIYMDSIEQVDR